jgi:hypothetical protein
MEVHLSAQESSAFDDNLRLFVTPQRVDVFKLHCQQVRSSYVLQRSLDAYLSVVERLGHEPPPGVGKRGARTRTCSRAAAASAL